MTAPRRQGAGRRDGMLLAIDGPDGAGKSTQVALLADWLAEHGVRCEVVSKWQVFDPERHPECRFLRGTDRAELRGCVAAMPSPARAMFVLWLYAQAAARAQRLAADAVVLVDGYWMKHAAAEVAYGADPALVEALVAALPPVDAVFYLDVDPAEALRRRQGELTPYECGLDPGLDPHRFLLSQHAIRAVLADRAGREGWHTVPAGPVEQMQAALRDRVWTVLAPALVGADG